jgi:hypothetical protein
VLKLTVWQIDYSQVSHLPALTIPDTHGNDTLICADDSRTRLADAVEPGWLPEFGNRLELRWTESSLFIGEADDSSASWAVAVYFRG